MPEFITVSDSDFSLGIDARSAETQIPEGFVRDLLNADVIERRVRKRAGTQGFAGNLPVRVSSVEYVSATDEICFTLDSALSLEDTVVDLSGVGSSPLVVYGRTSSAITTGGPFVDSADNVRYYSKFTIPTRKVFTTTNTPITVNSAEHGIDNNNILLAVVESTDSTSRSYQTALPNSISLAEANQTVTINYTNGTGANKDVFLYYSDRDTDPGSTYQTQFNHTGSGSEIFTIPAGTHNLDNFNIIWQLQEDTGADRHIVQPDKVVVEPDGDVKVTISTNSATTYQFLIAAAPAGNQVTGNIAGLSTDSIQITGLVSPWVFYSIFLEEIAGGDRESVFANTVSYDDTTGTATISVTNNNATARKFVVFYDYGVIRSNQICVTSATDITVDATDSRPQLTLWGLDHSEIYGAEKAGRSGWVNHIDSYRSTANRRLIAGLGGNLFGAYTYEERGAAYLYPALYPNLQARTAGNRILGPCFFDTGDTPARTRGYITGDDSGTGWASITSVTYDTGNGWTKYILSLPNLAILDSTGSPTTVGSVISVASNLEDWLTVTDMSYARHNGTFRIKQVTSGANIVNIWVENDQNSVDYDDTGTGGFGGIFTDQFVWDSTSYFISGDRLLSGALSDFVCTVQSSSGSTAVSDGLTSLLDLSGGILTVGRRSSYIVPLRTALPNPVASTTDLVRGDVLGYSDITRKLRVKSINPDSNRTVNITVSGSTVTCTLTSGDTSSLGVGRKILLAQAGDYTGAQTIAALTGLTSFTIDVEAAGNVTGALLVGETAEIDEELTWEDSTTDEKVFLVEERWIPLESPDDLYNETPSTYIRHFDSASYGNQSFLRSTMVVDNLYLTNGTDEVFKFDGTNLSRAGLPAWQPGLFLTQEHDSAGIPVQVRSISYSAIAAPLGRLTITAADTGAIPTGTQVRLSGSTSLYTVQSYGNDSTNYYLFVTQSLDSSVSATGSIAELAQFRYYYRLNYVDTNSNTIASAVTGAQDYIVELTQASKVHHKLVGVPVLGPYDYDRIEVEIYRTKQNTAAPFYRVTTEPLSFNRTLGYLNYTDTYADDDLVELDGVVSALKGSSLGTAWQEPLRAKYVTSAGNRLVLANIRDYPQLDVQFLAPASLTASDLNGKILTVLRDSADTATTTDMVNRARYEFRASTTGTASAFSIGTNQFSFTTSAGTGAVAGDWIYLSYSTVSTSSRNLTYAGWWQVVTVVGTTVTVNLTGAAAASSYPDRYTIATDPTDIPVLLGTDGNLGMQNGDSFDLFDSMRRLSQAVSASARMVDTNQSAYSTYSPWFVARGGNDVGKAGRLILRFPVTHGTTPAIKLPTATTSTTYFVNSVRQSAATTVAATTRRYPSRVLVSYVNYPEIIDNPTAVLDTESDSAIDINSADGQEITGVIPFFGEAAFGSAQQSAVLVVFKTNSIYLVDISQKDSGGNPVQRIETEGLGCTAPYSIAVTKNGIMFANESGIYCLRRNQSIQYIGQYMERNWEKIDLDQLELLQGHHYGLGRSYKLSVVLDGATEPDEVYVYNHTSEGEGKLGSWSRYDSHPAVGWANLDQDAFYASTAGRVLSLRRSGSVDDFRDDSEGINFQLVTRPNAFGNPAIRKILDQVQVNYRTTTRLVGTEVFLSTNTSAEFRESTSPLIPYSQDTSGIDDEPNQDVYPISHSTDRRKAIYFQVKVTNSSADEPLEIAGVDFRVGGLTEKGTLSAKRSQEK